MDLGKATLVVTREMVNRRLVAVAGFLVLAEFGGNAADVYAPPAWRFWFWIAVACIGTISVIRSERHKVRRVA